MEEFDKELSCWFKKAKRDFPWRENREPYRVLISEVMLQQTLASVVVSYFNDWMKKFPNFESLAKATEEEVIKAWEGLGYYSRARNLHAVAIRVIEEFGGVFPRSLDQILSFKGIGPYTAAAISHFAFDERVLGCDGNIKKVLARFYGYKGLIENDKELTNLLDKFLPEKGCSNSFEGLIELGATICLKKPLCERCPLQGGCVAYSEELTMLIPLRKKRAKTIILHRMVFLIEDGDQILIKKEEKNLMKGLHEFPFAEFDGVEKIDSIKRAMEKRLGCRFKIEARLKKRSHTFTKYKALLQPYRCQLVKAVDLNLEYFFADKTSIDRYPFSSGHRKIMMNECKSLAR